MGSSSYYRVSSSYGMRCWDVNMNMGVALAKEVPEVVPFFFVKLLPLCFLLLGILYGKQNRSKFLWPLLHCNK